MGLLLSVLITCVGVLEVIACYTHFRLGISYTQCKNDVTDIARHYAWELRRNHLHHLFPDGQPEVEYAKKLQEYKRKTSVSNIDRPGCSNITNIIQDDDVTLSEGNLNSSETINERIKPISNEPTPEPLEKTIEDMISNADIDNITLQQKNNLPNISSTEILEIVSTDCVNKYDTNTQDTFANLEDQIIQDFISEIPIKKQNIQTNQTNITHKQSDYVNKLVESLQEAESPITKENIYMEELRPVEEICTKAFAYDTTKKDVDITPTQNNFAKNSEALIKHEDIIFSENNLRLDFENKNHISDNSQNIREVMELEKQIESSVEEVCIKKQSTDIPENNQEKLRLGKDQIESIGKYDKQDSHKHTVHVQMSKNDNSVYMSSVLDNQSISSSIEEPQNTLEEFHLPSLSEIDKNLQQQSQETACHKIETEPSLEEMYWKQKSIEQVTTENIYNRPILIDTQEPSLEEMYWKQASVDREGMIEHVTNKPNEFNRNPTSLEEMCWKQTSLDKEEIIEHKTNAPKERSPKPPSLEEMYWKQTSVDKEGITEHISNRPVLVSAKEPSLEEMHLKHASLDKEEATEHVTNKTKERSPKPTSLEEMYWKQSVDKEGVTEHISNRPVVVSSIDSSDINQDILTQQLTNIPKTSSPTPVSLEEMYCKNSGYQEGVIEQISNRPVLLTSIDSSQMDKETVELPDKSTVPSPKHVSLEEMYWKQSIDKEGVTEHISNRPVLLSATESPETDKRTSEPSPKPESLEEIYWKQTSVEQVGVTEHISNRPVLISAKEVVRDHQHKPTESISTTSMKKEEILKHTTNKSTDEGPKIPAHKEDVTISSSENIKNKSAEVILQEVTLKPEEDKDKNIDISTIKITKDTLDSIEKLSENVRTLSPLPENQISESSSKTAIPEYLIKNAGSHISEQTTIPSVDLECEEILKNTSSDDNQTIPRVPSPYPMSLFGLSTDNGISDLVVNEDFLRSLDGVKPSRCDDRRRSFKKKRNSSSSSRASRDRSSSSVEDVVEKIERFDSPVFEKEEMVLSPVDERKSIVPEEDAKSVNSNEESTISEEVLSHKLVEDKIKTVTESVKSSEEMKELEKDTEKRIHTDDKKVEDIKTVNKNKLSDETEKCSKVANIAHQSGEVKNEGVLFEDKKSNSIEKIDKIVENNSGKVSSKAEVEEKVKIKMDTSEDQKQKITDVVIDKGQTSEEVIGKVKEKEKNSGDTKNDEDAFDLKPESKKKKRKHKKAKEKDMMEKDKVSDSSQVCDKASIPKTEKKIEVKSLLKEESSEAKESKDADKLKEFFQLEHNKSDVVVDPTEEWLHDKVGDTQETQSQDGDSTLSDISQNISTDSSVRENISAADSRKLFKKASISSFEEATNSQNEELGKELGKNDNEKRTLPSTEAFWVNEFDN